MLSVCNLFFRYRREITSYQEQISNMQNQLDKTKTEMTERLHEYQELLTVKLALDFEINIHRKLLEGEETRLSQVFAILKLFLQLLFSKYCSIYGCNSLLISNEY